MPKDSDDDVDETAADTPAEARDPSNPVVLDKYKQAALIAASTVHLLSSLCVPSATPLELCIAGEKHVEDELKRSYNRDKKMEKGLAFPVCVSINHAVGHVSPLSSDKDKGGEMREGDVVKLDLGVHIDGFVAIIAHTVVVAAAGSALKVDGKKADLMLALSTCHDAVMRCLRVGGRSSAVTDIIARICREFGVSPVQGVLSHSMDRFVLDGPRVILNRAGSWTAGGAGGAAGGAGSGEDRKEEKDNSRVDDFEFRLNDVFALDIVLSSGEGRPRALDDVTIYKRNSQSSYQLKMQISRSILSLVDKRSPVFPFSLRQYEESKAKFAMKECRQHELVSAYPVMQEKEGETVVQCKLVVHVTERGAVRLAGLPVDLSRVETAAAKKLQDDDVKKLLQQSVLLPVAGGGGGAAGGAGGNAKRNAAKRKKKAAKQQQAAGEGGKAEEKAAAATAEGEAGGGEKEEEEEHGSDESGGKASTAAT